MDAKEDDRYPKGKRSMSDITPRAARARLAAHQQWHPDDDEGIAERKRTLKESVLAKHIRETVDSAPPLSDEQRSRLALLLTGGSR